MDDLKTKPLITQNTLCTFLKYQRAWERFTMLHNWILSALKSGAMCEIGEIHAYCCSRPQEYCSFAELVAILGMRRARLIATEVFPHAEWDVTVEGGPQEPDFVEPKVLYVTQAHLRELVKAHECQKRYKDRKTLMIQRLRGGELVQPGILHPRLVFRGVSNMRIDSIARACLERSLKAPPLLKTCVELLWACGPQKSSSKEKPPRLSVFRPREPQR